MICEKYHQDEGPPGEKTWIPKFGRSVKVVLE
jgi:hypothetical protein